MKYNQFNLLLLFFLSLSSCRVFSPSMPAIIQTAPHIVLKPSYISVPLNIDVREIERRFNSEFEGLIYEDNSLYDNDNDNLMIKAWKRDKFSIACNGNVISYRLPLRLWIKAGFRIDKFGVKISDYREINADIALKYKTVISINPDWTLNVNTISDGHEWLSKPTIKIAGYDFPIKYIADILLKSSQKLITEKIDDNIRNCVDIKRNAEDIWIKLQQPISLDNNNQRWLCIKPIEISLLPLTGNNNSIDMTLALSSINEVIIGRKPIPNPISSLPRLNISNKLEQLFSIYINTDISYEIINSMSRAELTDRVFSRGRKKIIIKNIEIYGGNDNVMVKLIVDGSLKGNIYLKGKPAYNNITSTIEVNELEFDISTKNKLVKAAEWLLHENLERVIESKLKYNLGDKIDDYSGLINESLNNNKSIKGIILNGKLESLDIDNIYITDKSIKVIICLKGKLTCKLWNL